MNNSDVLITVSILIGLLVMSVSIAIVGLSPTFAGIGLGMFSWGIGYSFISGAQEAWLSDEVGETKANKAFIKVIWVKINPIYINLY